MNIEVLKTIVLCAFALGALTMAYCYIAEHNRAERYKRERDLARWQRNRHQYDAEIDKALASCREDELTIRAKRAEKNAAMYKATATAYKCAATSREANSNVYM